MSDGIYTYTLNDATIIPSSGVTPQVTCTATTTGSWAVPAGTVTQIITSVPDEITLTCTNPVAGVPGLERESNYQFRDRVWESQMSTVQGYPGFIRQKLTDVNGVQARLVSVVQDGNSWIIMCGGGDIYEMAGAIFKSAGDISRLKGATVDVTGITNANPGVVTTGITHGLTNGQVVNISGVNGMTGINNVPLNVTVLTPHTFSIGIDTSASGSWTGGGEVTPNVRNNVVTINDWPDNYLIPFVIPLQQNVTVKFEWGSEGVNYLTDATILTLVSAPVIQYINGIYAGKPLNINNLKDTFLQSVNATIDEFN
ncbi:ubiquitin-activating E1 FCCH domain-containing protein [Citrobacter portucalensis]|uniref:ubiquitin-activating E1 FCCH domain-containing protein n=1 Tax=Citrobacter portucalensis TaxID=1639133 RepID=UPI003F1ACA34